MIEINKLSFLLTIFAQILVVQYTAATDSEDLHPRFKRFGGPPVFTQPTYTFATPNCTFSAAFGRVSASSPAGPSGITYYTDNPYVRVDAGTGYISPLWEDALAMNYNNMVIVVNARNAYGINSAPVFIRSLCATYATTKKIQTAYTTTTVSPYSYEQPGYGQLPYDYGYNTGSSVSVYNSANNWNNVNTMTGINGGNAGLCSFPPTYGCYNGQCSYSLGSYNTFCSGIGNTNANIMNNNNMYTNVGGNGGAIRR